jgi:hypothetical protein
MQAAVPCCPDACRGATLFATCSLSPQATMQPVQSSWCPTLHPAWQLQKRQPAPVEVLTMVQLKAKMGPRKWHPSEVANFACGLNRALPFI